MEAWSFQVNENIVHLVMVDTPSGCYCSPQATSSLLPSFSSWEEETHLTCVGGFCSCEQGTHFWTHSGHTELVWVESRTGLKTNEDDDQNGKREARSEDSYLEGKKGESSRRDRFLPGIKMVSKVIDTHLEPDR